MDILRDIAELVKGDKEHFVKVTASWEGISVFLDYDPGFLGREECILPIYYSVFDHFAYIPDDEYRKMYCTKDYGIDLTEITLVKSIMEYLESHGEEIAKLCKGFDLNKSEE